MKAIFEGNATFDTPRPARLIERILQIAGDKDTLILGSFAGSGTTAHAVLNMNKADDGHRRFILIEMMDYADSITAERVKRVIDGYGEGKSAVEGTGGGFGYYELGPVLLQPDGNLNEAVGVEKIREYIWYTETKIAHTPGAGDGGYVVYADRCALSDAELAEYGIIFKKKIPVRTANFERADRTAVGHQVLVTYQAALYL